MDSPCGASVATSQGSVGLVASLPRLIGGKTVFTRLVATQASKKLNVVLTWSGSLDAKGSYLTTNGSLLKVPANNCP